VNNKPFSTILDGVDLNVETLSGDLPVGNKTLFAQLMDFLPWTTFSRIVTRYGGNHRVRTLPCTEHFRVLAFAQLTCRESLRDIEACLSAQSAKLYHMGIRSPIKRSVSMGSESLIFFLVLLLTF
jgi:hypothetical protein